MTPEHFAALPPGARLVLTEPDAATQHLGYPVGLTGTLYDPPKSSGAYRAVLWAGHRTPIQMAHDEVEELP